MKPRILLVEDEEHLRDTLTLNLQLEGYNVSSSSDGKSALRETKSARFDLLILDVMLPEMDGFSLCEKIRLQNRELPVLFLTAKNSPADRVKGLKLGADDYITKPFNLEELLLRVQNILRRSAKTEAAEMETYRFGGNEINFSSYEIKGANGKKQTLSKREIHLLHLLISRKNEVVSREKILEAVWEYDVYPSTRTIDNYILAFRKYFEKNPRQPSHFHSVRGVGYKFTA